MADSAEQRASEPNGSAPPRYSAFISYSSRDVSFARRLHRQLEGYRLPRRVADGAGEHLANSRSLGPIFRDSDELTAAHDLTTAVREALVRSECLIVICSPNAAKSVWVGREIEFYRSLHGDRRIYTALIEGTPATAFHAALLGGSGGPVQPLAADFRPDAGGRKLALLKLVAAVKGVELDRLVQRDAQRQVRRFAALATGAVAGIAVVAGLAVTAESARLRAAAMSGYMIADVGKVLESAGRSDEQAKITKEAMKNGPGGPAGLMLQANGFQKLGALDAQNGDLANARKEFEKAHRITRRLLRTGPDDPERIFAHAQSEYWIGFFNLRSGDTAAAKAKFEDYARLAQRLIRIDPRYDRWRHEVAYAELNLGMAAMRQAGNAAAAERHFKTSLDIVRSIAAKDPSNPGLQSELADKYAWLADSQRLQGDLEAALDSRMKQRAVLDRLFERDPRDVVVRADLLSNELALARIEADEGAAKAALQRLDQGLAAVTALQATNPANADTAKQARIFQLFRVRTLLDLAAREQRPASASALAETLGNCEAASPAVADPEIKDFCVALRSRALDMAGDTQAAAKLRTSLQRPNRGDAYSPRWGLSFADEMRPVRTTIVAGRN